MKPENVILEGVVGSTAYGLNHAGSDEDVKGIYIAPTSAILSLPAFQPKQTIDHTDPDWVYQEVGKYISLALKCNPTVTELLWLEGYTALTKQGKILVDNRHLFLSTGYVKNAYTGYCFSQAHKLNARGGTYGNGRNKRYSKHTRHLFRLLLQGRELLETGKLTVRVNPELRGELFAMGELPADQIINRFAEEIEKFKDIKSVLPDEPDYARVNELLLKIRKGNW
jgi:predicted nucleotidyltransferase